MDWRSIRQTSRINGENRNPDSRENGKTIIWNAITKVFDYVPFLSGVLNSKTADGIVSKGDDSVAANYIWKLDGSKNPAWRKEEYLLSYTTEIDDLILTMNSGRIITIPLGTLAWTDELGSQDSVAGNGTSGDKFRLANDNDNPGIKKYYGTNAIGAKGFWTIPTGVDQVNGLGMSATVIGAMGLPSTIDSTTENALTDHSHTHKVGKIDIANIIKTETDFEFLYKYEVTQDVRNISSSDDWIVPTHVIFEAMLDSIDTSVDDGVGNLSWLNAGHLLKSISTNDWVVIGEADADSYSFSWRGSGYRFAAEFQSIKEDGGIMCSDKYTPTNQYVYWASAYTNEVHNGGGELTDGWSLRLCNPTTELGEGEFGEYTQNNGEAIQTIVIGGVEWLCKNLSETEWRDHTVIKKVQDALVWESLVDESAYCTYETSLSELLISEHNSLQGLDSGDPDNNFFGHLSEAEALLVKELNENTIPIYADNATAILGGKTSGLYRTIDGTIKIVY